MGRVALWLLLLVVGVAGDVHAAVSARLERERIVEGETVRLQVEAQGQVSGQPDTTPLTRDFDVLGIASGSRVNIVNGRVDARTTWSITLSPKRSGPIPVPPLTVAGESTPALTLEVTPAGERDQGRSADLFIESELMPVSPYVQGMVRYTVRIYHAVPMADASLSAPQARDALIQRLGEDRQYGTTSGGRRYDVIERRYVLFPQASGEITLAGPVLDAQVPDARGGRDAFGDLLGRNPFFGRGLFDNLLTHTRTVRVRGEPHTMTVRPRPTQAQGPHWLPAQELELTEQWDPEQGPVRAGDPITRTLSIRARGLMGEQLPDLVTAPVEGIKTYPDKAQADTRELSDGVLGERTLNVALVPARSGTFTLPPLRLYWWDTGSNIERLAELPARTIEVLPAADASSAMGVPPLAPAPVPGEQAPAGDAATEVPVPAQAAGVSGGVAAYADPRADTPPAQDPWPWVSLGLALLWLATLGLWLAGRRSRRRERRAAERGPVPADEGAARRAFQRACQEGDAAGARAGVMRWAAAHWPQDPPRGLESLADRVPDGKTGDLLRALDRTLYHAQGGEWDGKPLSQALRRLPDAEPASPRPGSLPELYPPPIQATVDGAR